jgi:outer membrane protein W
MRTLKLGLGVFSFVCAVAGTAFAQEPDLTEEPAAAPAPTEAAPTTSAASTAQSVVVSPDEQSGGSARGKFVLGLRTGYSFAMGKTGGVNGGDSDLSDTISGHVPIWLDLGYMVTDNIMIGAYGQYGIGFMGDDDCDKDGVDCSASVIRAGLQGQYHFSPMANINPWLGVGIGYEWSSTSLSVDAQGQSMDISMDVRGFEYLNLQGGADFKLSPAFGLGPFVSFSLGQYDHVDGEVRGVIGDDVIALDVDEDLDDKSFHQWLTLGVRGSFML